MGDPNPPSPELYQDGRGWVTGFLVVHMLSSPSRRYIYVLWFVAALIFIIMTVLHWAGVRHGFIGATWTKWAIRRRTWRRFTRHPVSLPSNGQLVFLASLPIATILLCTVGPDYISPAVHVFDLGSRASSNSYWDPSTYVQFQPTYTIAKNWWTAGGRTGLIAFALFPLCIIFALKAPPFAVFAIPLATQIHFDKLTWLHRWSGRLIWVVTAAHVALWSVQLYKEKRPNTGVRVYHYAWLYPKFIWGWAAFGCLTFLILLSFPFLRRPHYETFYVFHVVFAPATLIFSALHHPPVAVWCWTALGLWCAERTYRFIRWLYLNGLSPFKPPNELYKTLQYSDIKTQAIHYPPSQNPSISPLEPSLTDPDQYCPPPGFSRAELVSGATVRLTYTPAKPISWAPGQHFLINIPSVSAFTTHPFTVASVCNERSPLTPLVFLIRCKNGWTRDLWHHVAELTYQGRAFPTGEASPVGSAPPKSGTLLRTLVEGPFGSSVRTHWGSHSSVLIIVGGSGVTFGLSILEFICLCMAGHDPKSLGSQSGTFRSHTFSTRRVRFIWLVREFAHLQWCASILRRCRDTVSRRALKIDIFVTNYPPILNNRLSFVPASEVPQETTEATHPDPNSAPLINKVPKNGERVTDNASDDEVDLSLRMPQFGDEEALMGDLEQNYTLDLTEFDGDQHVTLPGEDMFNRQVRKVATIRRAKSRKERPSSPPQVPSQKRQSKASSRTGDDLLASRRISFAQDWELGYESGYATPASAANSRPTSPTAAHQTSHYRGYSNGQRSTDASSQPLFTQVEDFAGFIRPSTPLSQLNQPSGMDAHPHLHVDQQELRDLSAISESARPGKPRLDRVVIDEAEKSLGSLLVACCGPTSLNAIVRKAVAMGIDPHKVRKGEERGFISLISEDFAY